MGSPVLALSSTGHLASKLTHDTRIGSSSCPWALHVPKGQTINITLYDFGVHDAKLTTGQYFPKYFVIKEPAITKEATVYAGSERVRRVYSSTSNELQIDIFDKMTPKTLTNFIILYQGEDCCYLPNTLYKQLNEGDSHDDDENVDDDNDDDIMGDV